MVLAGLVVLLTLSGLASSARATAAEGVHFDPDSPAGKEYALPLNQARGEATGGSGEDSGAGAPLFGAGVSPPGSPGAQVGASAQPAGPGSGTPGAGASGPAGSSAGRGAAASPAAIVRISEAGDGYPLTSAAALVAAILLLGGALGLALRGLQRRTASS